MNIFMYIQLLQIFGWTYTTHQGILVIVANTGYKSMDFSLVGTNREVTINPKEIIQYLEDNTILTTLS